MIQKLKDKRKDKKGFTLVEVIVVLVILVILLAIAIPSVTQYISKAKDKEAQLTARNIYLAASVALSEELIDKDTATAADILDEVKSLSNVSDITEGDIVITGDVVTSVTYKGYTYSGAGVPTQSTGG